MRIKFGFQNENTYTKEEPINQKLEMQEQSPSVFITWCRKSRKQNVGILGEFDLRMIMNKDNWGSRTFAIKTKNDNNIWNSQREYIHQRPDSETEIRRRCKKNLRAYSLRWCSSSRMQKVISWMNSFQEWT